MHADSSTHVGLTEFAQRFVKRELEQGRFDSAEQVVDEAISLLERKRAREAEVAKLNDLIEQGVRSAREEPLLDGESVFADILAEEPDTAPKQDA
jgi:putative addiction module CopG family antidote